jgi:pSer/pThr/pTyr-binding forkhead associated (FHA) protein
MLNRVILRAMNGNHKGQEFVLENEGDYTLGRARDCSCVLDDPLYLVSRRHCRIEVHAPLVRIQDLGSRNGTQVNGKSIGRWEKGQCFEEFLHKACAEHPLDDGDILDIAGYDFRVQFEPKVSCAVIDPCDRERPLSCKCASC